MPAGNKDVGNNPVNSVGREVIENRFTYHPPTPDQVEKYQALREAGMELAVLIDSMCPRSRETSVAMTKLDEVIMFANAAIARHDKPGNETKKLLPGVPPGANPDLQFPTESAIPSKDVPPYKEEGRLYRKPKGSEY